jgi:heterodisulfide reductase subunit C
MKTVEIVPPKVDIDSQGGNGKPEWNIPPMVSEFSDIINKTSGVDLNVCFQCRKCHVGCPVAFAMDYTPVQLLHAARLGLKDLVLGSKTIWLCASCETCVTRCPQDIDLVKIMDSMRLLALRNKVKPGVPEIAKFYRSSLINIRLFGQTYELGLIGQLKMATLQITKDLSLGIKMLMKGRLTLLPNFSSLGRANRLFSRALKMEQKK